MQLQQLTYLLEVAQTGSMNKAAQNLFISQPTLSNSISNLEKELNISIFTRTSKGVEVTPEGKLLIKYARSILGQVDQLKNIYSSQETNDSISVIQLSQTKNLYLTDAIQNMYNLSYNHIKFTISISPLANCIKDVFSMKSELAFITLSQIQKSMLTKTLEHRKLEFVPILDTEVCLIVSKDNPISQKEMVPLDDLSGLTFIDFLDESSSPIKYSVDLSELWSDSSVGTITVNDLESQRNLLHSIHSYSFDLIVNEPYLMSKGLQCIPLEEKIEVSLGYIKIKNEPLTPQSTLFLNEVLRIYSYKKNL